MKCFICKKEITDESKIKCPKCGAPVNWGKTGGYIFAINQLDKKRFREVQIKYINHRDEQGRIKVQKHSEMERQRAEMKKQETLRKAEQERVREQNRITEEKRIAQLRKAEEQREAQKQVENYKKESIEIEKKKSGSLIKLTFLLGIVGSLIGAGIGFFLSKGTASVMLVTSICAVVGFFVSFVAALFD